MCLCSQINSKSLAVFKRRDHTQPITEMAKSRCRNYLFTIFPKEDTDQPWDPNTINFLCAKPAVQYVVCQLEKCPTTGRIHWQGYIEFVNAVTYKGAQGALEEPTCHLEPRRGSRAQAVAYCTKDDSAELDEDGEQIKFEFGSGDHRKTIDEHYDVAMNTKDYESALKYLQTNCPRDFVLNNDKIKQFLCQQFMKWEPDKAVSTTFKLQRETNDTLKTLAIVLSGKPGTGKTNWCLSHFQHPLLISHIDDLKDMTPLTDGLIFDDMTFGHWPPQAAIHLLDCANNRSINVKYGKVRIPKGMPRMFTSNKAFYDMWPKDRSEHEEGAIYRRIKHHYVIENLY